MSARVLVQLPTNGVFDVETYMYVSAAKQNATDAQATATMPLAPTATWFAKFHMDFEPVGWVEERTYPLVVPTRQCELSGQATLLGPYPGPVLTNPHVGAAAPGSFEEKMPNSALTTQSEVEGQEMPEAEPELPLWMLTVFHDLKFVGVEDVNTSPPLVTIAQKRIEGQEIPTIVSALAVTSWEAGQVKGSAAVGDFKIET